MVGILAIELGRVSRHGIDAIRQRVDAALEEAAATLERIDVAHAIGEARLRSEAETLRAALIGSVSHELGTPLASILGSASVLAQAPSVVADARLASLVDIIRGESERLNIDIQNLLDASRISGAGVLAHLAWAEPPDLVNAALARLRHRLSEHRIDVQVAEDLAARSHRSGPGRAGAEPADRQRRQVFAARHHDRDRRARRRGKRRDHRRATRAPGLTAEERERLFERFYRGPRHQTAIKGSGLGLWIARAFVVASGGQLEAASEGAGRGTTMTVRLPAPPLAEADRWESGDE